jgi:hypothetical protein
MTKDAAQVVAQAWRGRGYDVRIVASQGDYSALVLLEDGQRWLLYTADPSAHPFKAGIGESAGSLHGALSATVTAPEPTVTGG